MKECLVIILRYFAPVLHKNTRDTHLSKVDLMNTHNMRFLQRIKKSYPKIITKYSGTSIIQSPRDQTVLFELLRL